MSTTEATDRSGDARKRRDGTVIKRSGDKTVVVAVERRVRHPLYGKTVRRVKKVHAHDARNETAVGDRVTLVETRPLSKMKRWRVATIDRRATEADRERAMDRRTAS